MNKEYNLGYFEGVRNVYMAFSSFHHHDDNALALQRFIEWIGEELAEAKRLRDEE